MKEIEAKLFSLGMPEEALMEKVGLGIKEWFLNRSKLLKEGVVVLVGPGNNGGDGLVLARELFLSGIDVSLWCPIPIKSLLTAKHFSYCNSIGIKCVKDLPDVYSNAIWVEAIFGLGQSKPIPHDIGLLLRERERLNPGKLVSLDVPAGICSDTGKRTGGDAAFASFTLTVGLFKAGLLQDIAIPYVGDLQRIDIGVPKSLLEPLCGFVPLTISADDCCSAEFPQSRKNASKYERGRLLFIGGSQKFRGACLLALRGAISSGVGSIQAVLTKQIAEVLCPSVPEVIFHNSFNNLLNQEISLSKSFAKIQLDRIDSLVIGPGLGILDEKWNNFATHFEGFPGLLVLDADGLNCLSRSSEGWEWLRKREGPTWITPHVNEFQRLFPEIDSSCPLEAASSAARISGAGVLLKGAHSVVADPGGSVWQLRKTSHLVARTGLGDLLAGFLGGIGALSISSNKKIDSTLFALGVLIHAQSASLCEEGTNADSIAKTLGRFVKSIQAEKVRFDT